MQSRRLGWLLACAVNLTAIVASAETILESGPRKTRLLELFTSEGCSSCPPAEAWLSKLKSDPQLWRDFAPVAFHVDYWDRLGWRDPFASREWTQRQYQYSASWKSESVYTPGFILDGREWRNNGIPSPSNEKPGVLRISIANGGMVTAIFRSATDNAAPLDLHLAQLGFGLVSNAKAGENSGRKLEHDFVVLSLASETLRDGKAQVRLAPASKKTAAPQKQALVAWVTTWRTGGDPGRWRLAAMTFGNNIVLLCQFPSTEK